MDIAMNDFEYERRFFCRALPPELDDGEPMLIVQSYYVHDGNYALRVRLQTHGVRIDMNADTDPIAARRRSAPSRGRRWAAPVMRPNGRSTPA